MKFKNLFDSTTAEPDFVWHENPTKEQMDEIAGKDGKVHFVAFPEKKVVVFPFGVPYADFLEGTGKSISQYKDKALFGTAQKTGFKWMLLKIANSAYVKPSEDWMWLDKYIDIKTLMNFAWSQYKDKFRATKDKSEEEVVKNLEDEKGKEKKASKKDAEEEKDAASRRRTDKIKDEIRKTSNVARDRFRNIYDRSGDVTKMEKVDLKKLLKDYGKLHGNN
jgi:hypothetical protein